MPAETPLEQELLDRIVAEAPQERAIRRAHERWVVVVRLWAMFDRRGLVDSVSRLEAASQALWPTMPEAHREELLAAARRDPALGPRRPERFEDVMSPAMAALLRAAGYSDGDAASAKSDAPTRE